MKKILSLTAALLFLSGCASEQRLSTQSALNKYGSVAELTEQVKRAQSSDIPVLSQDSYDQAVELQKEAVDQARAGNNKALTTAKSGLRALKRATKNATRARQMLAEVIEVRNKALAAGARQHQPKAFEAAEKQLREIASLIEENETHIAKDLRLEAIQAYADLELSSLKQDTVAKAKQTIERALKEEADDYAPKTLSLAQDEYRLTLSVLEANRENRESANMHAQKAINIGERAIEITRLAKKFEANDFSHENILLWYQTQLKRIVEPAGIYLPFNKSNGKVIATISHSLTDLQQQNKELQTSLAQAESEIDQMVVRHDAELADLKRSYEKELADIHTLTETEKLRRQRMQAKLKYVQSLFNKQEADVYLDKENILIRAHGFDFNSGSSEITAANFPLLNKIERALEKYPDSPVIISGHTDSTGDPLKNLSLSSERAQNVASFLANIGRIPENRLSAEGFGQTKPVADNTLESGRAENRRVEFLIVNDPSALNSSTPIPAAQP